MLGISAPHLLAFVLVAVAVIASRAITSGRRVALRSALGNSAGVYAQAVAVAFGMGVLAEQSLALFFAMKLAGGAYLIYLGIKTLRERGQLAAPWEAPTEGVADRAPFPQAAMRAVPNPKTVVFLAAILPRFARGQRHAAANPLWA